MARRPNRYGDDYRGQSAEYGGAVTGLDAHVVVTLGSLTVDAAIQVAPGEVVALIGPNGAGKTTVLRAIAGLLPLDAGHVRVDEVGFDDQAGDVFVAATDRSVGVVFQQYHLFPAMTALENVAFGLRARGRGRREAREVAQTWLDRVGLTDSAVRRPGELSGGQCQRVALARALACEPSVLVFDEPLAALDAQTRADVRRDLRRFLDGFAGPCLIVTHDPIDAHALADRIVVLEGGRVVQSGTLADIAAHPRSRYVAELVGVNLVLGNIADGVLVVASGARLVVASTEVNGEGQAVIRPQAIALHAAQPHGSPRNCWLTTVTDIDTYGDRVRVRVGAPIPLVAEITPGAMADLGLRIGGEVWVSVKATEVTVFAN
jgi:molybdate transport system ATP-binding protein